VIQSISPEASRGAAERRLRACVIGKGDLLLQCAQLLLDHGYEIAAIASASSRVETWAGERGILCAGSLSGLLDAVDLASVDDLFSIINPEIVPADVLRLPRRLAINYHNSPLPRYAGVFATSWAILHGEQEHGVTWHVMEPRLDAGDILKQVRFPIDDDETTFSLNVKCHEHAVAAFAQLAAELKQGEIARRPQDLAQRSYFGAHRKLPDAGILSWDAPASRLDRTVRALSFGDSPNRLGVAKLQAGDTFFVPQVLRVLARRSGAAPGTVLAIGPEGLEIATATEDVRLGGALGLTGERLTPPELAQRCGLRPGSRLPASPPDDMRRFEQRVVDASPHEPFWREKVKTAVPLSLAVLGLETAADGDGEALVSEAAVLSDETVERLATLLPAGVGLRDALLTALLVGLGNESGEPTLSVGLAAGWGPGAGPLDRLFVDHVVLTVTPPAELSFVAAARLLAGEAAAVLARGRFLRDIVLRHPMLRGKTCRLPVAIEWDGEAPAAPRSPESRMTVILDTDARQLRLMAWAGEGRKAAARSILQGLLRHVLTLLSAAAAEPLLRLADLPLLTRSEEQQVVREWNDTGRAWSDPAAAHQLVAERARRSPAALAVVADAREWTYAELDARAASVAAALRDAGVGAGGFVAVYAQRSPELVAALLGILRLGAVYVPLDPAQPEERLLQALADCAAGALLLGPGLERALPPWRRTRLSLAAACASPGPPPPPEPAGEDLPAFLMLTSGSTGRPKGVLCTHGGLANRLRWALAACALGAEDRVLQVAAIGFDISVVEMLLPLCAGGRLVIAAPELHRDPSYLVAVIRRQAVTLVHFVPTLLRAFLEHPESGLCHTLAHAFSGGEALPAELVERLLARLPARLYNAYGPTETSISVTHWEARAGCRPLLGRPIAGCTVFLLDPHLRPVPPGSTGEICIGGSGVAQGYLGDPALTAERFIPDAFGGAPGARLYRTGDLARLLPTGEIDFLGRRDGQVKVRGIRVELGEIESLLARHPGIEQAVVLERETAPGERRLVAYLLCHQRDQTVAGLREQLRRHLLAMLPEAMVPTFFVFLAAIPLLPSGKVKRAALPEPTPEDRVVAADYAAPQTQLEGLLAGAWSEILALPLIGMHDDVFSLGAHSLHATRMKLWLHEQLGIELPLRVVFESRTVARLAALLEPSWQERGEGAVAAEEMMGGPRFPLSFAQERVWFLDQLLPSQGLYNVPIAFALRGRLLEGALAQALERVVRRHDALVSRLVPQDGELWQERAEPAGFALRVIDLTALPASAREPEAGRLMAIEARRAFDLDRGPLIRAWLLRTGPAAAVLVVVAHHIAFDGWSTAVFCRDLSRAYEDCRRGEEPALPPPKAAFGQLAAWQRQAALRGDALERSLVFWEQQLAGAPTLELPVDFRPPRPRSHRGAVRRLRLPAATWEAVRALGERQGATPFMTLLAAFQVLLHRWTEQTDVVVGTPFAGRSHPLANDLVGMFVNSVALRGSLADGPGFLRVLERAREATLAAHEHQDAPFEKVVERLRVARSPDRHPVFQTMLVLNPGWQGDLRLDGVAVEPLPVASPVAMFDLTLTAEERAGGLELELEYAAELFAPPTLERLARSLARLLEAVAADPVAPVGDHELLSAGERHALLVEWNDTAAPLPPGLTVVRLFEERAAETPGAPAVIGDGGVVTYAELNAGASRLAARLRRLGAGPESRVALLLERSPDLIMALLGILKAGAAYVPLDPQAPAERLEGIVAEAGVACLVTRSGLAAALPGLAVPRVRLDADREGIAAGSAEVPRSPAGDRHAAYALYTSGTTGRPKGVLVEHRSLLNYVLAAREQLGLRPADRVLQFASIAFDTAAEEIYPTLLAGGALVLGGEPALEGVSGLLGVCRRHGVTVLDLPTAYFHLLAAEPPEVLGELPPALRLVIVGGERLLPESLRRWLAGPGGSGGPALLNTYGPTEATIVTTSGRLGAGWDAGRGEPAIGRPVWNAAAYVLDGAARPVPAGVPGELCIGGAGVARGYLGRPAETAERFVPDPFSPSPGAVMYRTGDQVRWRPDGQLEFLGRLDRQVKIRGYRVEPAEVEAALARHPAVGEVAVVVRGDAGDPRLMAFVAPRSGGACDAGELRRHVEGLLPGYMVPARLFLLPELPHLVSGKVDRRFLEQAPLLSGEDETAPAGAPRTALERDLAALCASLLGLPSVGVDDDFFALGGHSLLATRLVSRLRGLFAVEIPLRAFFSAPTVAGLARAVAAARRDARSSLLPPIGRREPGRPVPLTPAQRRICFLEAIAAEPGLYNVPSAYRVREALDPGALRRALDRAAERHEALRSAVRTAGELVQTFEAGARLPLSVVDLTALPEEARREALAGFLDDAGLHPFDLARPPLWRAHLALLAPQESVLLLVAHHVIADGWSMDLLRRDLVALYGAELAGAAPALPPVEVQYGDFAAWLETELAGSDRLAAQLGFWREALQGAPEVLDLPVDRPRRAGTGNAGGSLPARLARPELDRLRALGQAHEATLFMTLLALGQLFLHRLSGQDDLVMGTPIANRHYPGVEATVGLFVNSLPVRSRLAAGASFSDLLRAARQGALEAFEHQDVPFEHIVEALGVERHLDRTPLFQTVLTLEEPALAAGDGWEEIGLTPGLSKLDLALTAREGSGALELLFDYRTALFDRATVARFARALETLAGEVLRDPSAVAAELPLLAAAERHQILAEWNDRSAEDLGEAPLHRLFEAQVARTPDLPAVVDGDRVLTYRELDAEAESLARRLRRAGIGPEAAVGVALERSAGLVAAILAVFKAGGVYVPLDPANPRERLLSMIETAGVRLLVADGQGEPLAAGFAGEVVRPAGGHDPGGASPPRVEVTPDHAAYVLFTSGSTGSPKGVVVPHRGIANRVVWSLREHPAGPGDALLHIAQTGFDIALWEVFYPLLAGARLVIAPPGAGRDPEELHRAVVREGITVLHFVPTLLEPFLAGESRGSEERLRLVVCGGETVSAGLLRRYAERTAARLCHAYGPTEASISVAHWELDRAALPGLERVPLGRPLAGARLLVLDAALQPVPPGMAGELCIAGIPLARGYAGRPDLTAERFAPDPWSPAPGGRLYRTGDWARHRADGLLELLGRRDRQLKIRGYRIEAGEVEAVLELHPAVRQAVAGAFTDAAGRTRLAAWIVCRDAPLPAGLEAERKLELRRHLEERLPEPLVPSALVLLDRLPLLPTGKVDRRALPAPQLRQRLAGGEPVPPRTATEARLAALWAELLGLEQVGVLDNFFAVGGDSIASIQLVARARQAGILFDVAQLFRTPTVAGLAAAAMVRDEAPAATAGDDLPAAGLPLAPLQRRFLERSLAAPAHFNQSLLLSAAPGLRPADVRQAVGALVAHHDALRLRFRRGAAGWEQGYSPLPTPGEEPWTAIDLSAVPAAQRQAALATAAAQAQASLDPWTGTVFRAAWLELGEDGARLLAVAHHLVVDVASWRILLQDLEAGVRQAARGEEIHLPAKTRSYGAWAQALEELATVDRPLDVPATEAPDLPLDRPGGRNLEADAETATVTLDEERTRLLLERVPGAYGNRVPEVLLAAATLALGDLTGRPALLVEVEGHGREPLSEDMDVSRTVGWLTSIQPLWIELSAPDDPGRCLKEVKERARRAPGRWTGGPRPGVTFNYLGPSLASGESGGMFRLAAESPGPVVSPANPREAALEIGAAVRRGRLEVEWTFSREQLSPAGARRLADRFRDRLCELVDHAARPEVWGYTPADFPLAGLDQETLDALLGDIRGVEDVYPLSPLQGGFLFQALYRPGTTAYFTQIVFELRGDVREELLREAWRLVIERHAALRSAFLWQDVAEPVQYVVRAVELPWGGQDWRETPAAARRERLAAFLEEDRLRGLCLGRPPLLRFTFLDLGPGRAWLVWSHQHILLDGWSLPIVFGEVMEIYRARVRGEAPSLRPAGPFRDYIAWLRRQDRERAESFWRHELQGLSEPFLLGREPAPGAAETESRLEVLTLPAGLTEALRGLARDNGLTLSAVVQAAWAFFLGRYTGRQDVIFGVTVAGRPQDLPGVEGMVGLFINTVPLRVRLADDEDLTSFLAGVQQRMAQLQEHAHLPLARIQACSGAVRGRPLFDTLIVFENYPLSRMSQPSELPCEVVSVEALERTEYPLSLTVLPGEELRIELSYSPERFDSMTVQSIAGYLAHVLEAFAGAAIER
jgi:amino acid adenylation domain-containing protein/non-ribosomal peptide synthase protein (TIGR01720 family)